MRVIFRSYTCLLFATILTSSFSSSCVTGDSKMEANPSAQADDKYHAAYEASTRKQSVFINFETKYTVAATYLSPEFRSAFAKRFENLFNAPQPFLEEASAKAGFFVTVFSPADKGYDLTDDQLWSVQLQTNDRALKPILIKRLNNKDRWKPFFVDVHNWSIEYLVLFDTPSVSTDNKMVEKNTLSLLIANSEAKVSLNW